MRKNTTHNTFSDLDQAKALTIVRIFETSRRSGDYTACVVLNDGAGISYGAYQFTHRSGSLAAVVKLYLRSTSNDGLASYVPRLCDTSRRSIKALSGDVALKRALRAAAITGAMRAAQDEVAREVYLRPAVDLCMRRGFVRPLSLAVVYDSIVHGSLERLAATIRETNEKDWITDYVRRRHAWLSSVGRLRPTTYRTQFFLDQIAVGNWELRMPINVHGLRLTDRDFAAFRGAAATNPQNKENSAISPPLLPPNAATESLPERQSWPPILETTEKVFDRVDDVVTGVATRTDRAKSLWATVVGAVGQAAWAIVGFFAGLPREVWITVAVIAAVLTLVFLYRQFVLGKMRESQSLEPKL